jgi:hypothetical protein
MLGPYLAGLIEGDGSIIVPELTSKKNKPFEKEISQKEWEITAMNSCDRALLSFSLRCLPYLNKKNNIKFVALKKNKLDISPIVENAWLSGMTDADGNFNVVICKRKHTQNSYGINNQYTLEQRQQYHRLSLFSNSSYLDIIVIISKAFNVNLYERSRKINNTTLKSYLLSVGSINSNIIVSSYFTKFPLYSSKRLDFIRLEFN